MMKFAKIVAVALAMGVVVATLSGCQKQEGPAERAGKAMDNAMENAGQQMEKAGENLQDAARDARK
jgi:predicted small secreted protein